MELQLKGVIAAMQGIQIEFCWVPSHIGFPGNKQADRAPAMCSLSDLEEENIPFTDHKPVPKCNIKTKWQYQRYEKTSSKLHVKHQAWINEKGLGIRTGFMRLFHGA